MKSKILSSIGIDPGIIILVMFVLIIILFVITISTSKKYDRLKNSYSSFMKGKDGRNLEESMRNRFAELDAILKVTRQNKVEVKEMSRNVENNFHKLGIVRYDAFNEMGGKLSFAIALLNTRNNGFILNSMHSREGCYTYLKEIVNGESFIELSEEESEALDKAVFQDVDLSDEPKKK